jgi:hypothetical protein
MLYKTMSFHYIYTNFDIAITCIFESMDFDAAIGMPDDPAGLRHPLRPEGAGSARLGFVIPPGHRANAAVISTQPDCRKGLTGRGTGNRDLIARTGARADRGQAATAQDAGQSGRKLSIRDSFS